ncbi:hypothetical protein SLS62_007337 [Diatrype stigma]|uniref:C2H2-type domain-containing protein n=1 Tax=Diatrype stigma TaxID=117547 RepID=A0AAN9YQW0_9PEZI
MLSMTHESLTSPPRLGYDMTTPNSTLTGYYPSDMKNDFHPLVDYDFSATPCRKGSIPAQATEFDYAQMFNSLPPHNQTMEPSNPEVLGNLQYTHHILASPFAPANMCSDAPECDASSVWCAPEDPMGYFTGLDKHEPTSLLSTRSMDVNDKRRVYVDGSQHKSAALHRAQRLQRVKLRRVKREDHQLYPRVIKSGTHKCPYPQCETRNAFKRSEHLKRHVDTHHNPSFIQCPFCDKRFNRKDNWVQHIILHSQGDRASKRTRYHSDAQALVDEEKRKNKSRSQTKRKKLLKNEEDD